MEKILKSERNGINTANVAIKNEMQSTKMKGGKSTMKILKKISFSILIVAFALCLIEPLSSVAETYSIPPWYADFYSGHYSEDTDVKNKYDDSSVYFSYEEGTVNYVFLKIWGCNNGYKTGSEDCTGWYLSTNFPTTYTVYVGDDGYYSNSVNELGHTYVFLRLMLNYWDGNAYGHWNPNT